MTKVKEQKTEVTRLVKKARGYIFMSFDDDGMHCYGDVRRMNKVREDVRHELMRDLWEDTKRVFEVIRDSFQRNEEMVAQAARARKMIEKRSEVTVGVEQEVMAG